MTASADGRELGRGGHRSDPALADFPDRAPGTRRWCFADQLGPHFLDAAGASRCCWSSRGRCSRRRRFHRRRRTWCCRRCGTVPPSSATGSTSVQAETYREALDRVGEPLTVCAPTSWRRRRLRRCARPGCTVLRRTRLRQLAGPTSLRWAAGRGAKRLLMEDFYRDARRRHDVLMDGERAGRRPVEPRRTTTGAATRATAGSAGARAVVAGGGRDRRARCAPTSTAGSATATSSFVGRDGPRLFPATRREALAALQRLRRPPAARRSARTRTRCSRGDPWMAHSCCRAPLNLGLLDPLECVRPGRAAAYRAGRPPPLNSVEGFVRQVIGWRDYIWHLYWHFGADYRRRNAPGRPARRCRTGSPSSTPTRSRRAACRDVLADVRDHGWVHHIPRLMVLGNYALQRGWRPAAVTDWFHRVLRRRLRLGDGRQRRRHVASTPTAA